MDKDEQTKKIREQLDAMIPRAAVKEREGGSGRSFSYLSGDYVINRLNEVFGQGNWNSITEKNACVHSGQDGNNKFTVHYIAQVRLEFPTLGCVQTGTGYGDGSDKYNVGKAHELAAKEAETDALKRAAKNLGMSMGLALYDKDQVNVDDGPQETAKTRGPSTPTEIKPASRAGNSGRPPADKPKSVGGSNGVADKAQATPPLAGKAEPQLPKASEKTREEVNGLISSTARVVVAKKKKTTEEIRSLMKEKFGAEDKAKLNDTQAKQFLGELQALI